MYQCILWNLVADCLGSAEHTWETVVSETPLVRFYGTTWRCIRENLSLNILSL